MTKYGNDPRNDRPLKVGWIIKQPDGSKQYQDPPKDRPPRRRPK